MAISSGAKTLDWKPFEFYKLFPANQALHESKAKIRVLKASRRYGKGRTACMDMVLHIHALANMERGEDLIPRYFILLVAPTYRDARQMWAEAKELIPSFYKAKINENDLEMELLNGGHLEVRSTHEPGSIKGIGVDFAWIAEASLIPEERWHDDIRPTLFSPGRLGKAIVESIACETADHWFEVLYERGQDPDDSTVESWAHTYLDSPLLTEEQKREIEAEQEFMPIGRWERQYMAKTGQPENAVFTNVGEIAIGEVEEPQEGVSYYMGLDLGKAINFTVAAVARKDAFQVVYVDRLLQRAWDVQEDRIVELAQLYNNCPIIADATGLGAPICAALRKRGCAVRDFKFGRFTKPDLIEHLILAFERKEITIPKAECGSAYRMMVRELKNYRRDITSSSYERFGPRLGEHDDCIDALALAWKNMPRRAAVYSSLQAPKPRSYLVSMTI